MAPLQINQCNTFVVNTPYAVCHILLLLSHSWSHSRADSEKFSEISKQFTAEAVDFQRKVSTTVSWHSTSRGALTVTLTGKLPVASRLYQEVRSCLGMTQLKEPIAKVLDQAAQHAGLPCA